MKQTTTGARRRPLALRSQVRAMLRDVEVARDPGSLKKLRALLSEHRHRPVSLEDARRFFEDAAGKWRAQGSERVRTYRKAAQIAGKCSRCPAPAAVDRDGNARSKCVACNEAAKAAMRRRRQRLAEV